MFGFVPNSKAKELITNSETLILPTQYYEGFLMLIFEVYSVGTLVIIYYRGSMGKQ
jgi:glycosyltransferase involved in cell wall biosynthesis